MTDRPPTFIYGAGVVGKVLLGICHKAGITVNGFIDRDLKGNIEEIPIYPPETVKTLNPDTLYLVSVMSLQKVIPTLKEWLPGGSLLGGIDTKQKDYQMDDTKYQVESVRIAHKAFMENKVFLRSLDVMITEKCSLKCRDCSNLMQYFKDPVDYESLDVLRDIDAILKNVDEILEARVMGGDAFMNRQWPLFAEYLAFQKKVHRVVLYTNGVILPKVRDIERLTRHKWVAPKVIVAITDYGKLSINVDILIGALRQIGISYRIARPTEWVDCASIKKHDRTPEDNDRLFQNCVANNLTTLAKGGLFRCPFAASASLLGVTSDMPSDDLIVATASKEALNDYILSNKAMSACDFCTSRILANKIEPAIQTKEALKI